ncbi:MAG: hypothetical protein CVU54_11275 [Deltaproteobacteria bacterium HGW-Deltaproteobacteria-12]|jgi:predicted Zn finger-like uncharacterized protein|nr:MAG: hypothetical protein CVU54_11275 [Deltaproteobacteria bacterium HGW-Deltaproteobacteria-12]
MIIQCRQCRTKFRFADDLMEGDGVWLRCSHCQHVFFQDNPQTVHSKQEPLDRGDLFSASEDLPARETIAENHDVAILQANGMKTSDGYGRETAPEIAKPSGAEDKEDESAAAFELQQEDQKQKGEKTSPGGFWRVLKVAAWIITVIVVIPAVIYFFVFPEMGDRLLKVVNSYVDIGIREPARPEIVAGQVKLQDIRQRMLNNYVLGPIRIVEGTAVNQADYSIARIVIKGEIVDAYAVILGEQSTYAGNVLNDEELAVLPEEDILKRLARPEGGSNSNDKIMPNGMIPFMIVFTREPAGVIKTTVKTIGAERLL